MADHERDGDQERGMQRRSGSATEPYNGGEMRYYGDPDWRRGFDAWGNPVWYRAYGWSWRSGGQGQREQEPHEHGRTTSRHYQRSDERIRDDVYDRLNDHPNVDSSDIRVSVKDCEVTLEGTVHDRREKRMAEDIAESVSGVSDVQNHVRLEMGQHDQNRHRQRSGAGGKMNRSNIKEGMRVKGSNGDEIGKVKRIRENDFLVDRSGDRDVFVPFNACERVEQDSIMLNIPASKVDEQDWAQPDLIGGKSGGSDGR